MKTHIRVNFQMQLLEYLRGNNVFLALKTLQRFKQTSKKKLLKWVKFGLAPLVYLPEVFYGSVLTFSNNVRLNPSQQWIFSFAACCVHLLDTSISRQGRTFRRNTRQIWGRAPGLIVVWSINTPQFVVIRGQWCVLQSHIRPCRRPVPLTLLVPGATAYLLP